MNNKGFAITGIIYTLFVLFLMILLSVLSGLSSFQKLVINSTSSLETSFEGKEISTNKLNEIKANGIAPYMGKYIFKKPGTTLECSSYLDKGTVLDLEIITLFPNECATYASDSFELIKVYSFEEES